LKNLLQNYENNNDDSKIKNEIIKTLMNHSIKNHHKTFYMLRCNIVSVFKTPAIKKTLVNSVSIIMYENRHLD
jgi:hypothetical protein